MRKIVRLLRGSWVRRDDGQWDFAADPTDLGFGAMIDEEEKYESLLGIVRSRYMLNPSTPVSLSYEYPDRNRLPDGRFEPPITISTDVDTALFMAVRTNYPDITLLVTVGHDGLASNPITPVNSAEGDAIVPVIRTEPDVISAARVEATQSLLEAMFSEEEIHAINRVHMEREVNQNIHLRPSSGNQAGLVPRDYRPNDVIIIIDADDDTLMGGVNTVNGDQNHQDQTLHSPRNVLDNTFEESQAYYDDAPNDVMNAYVPSGVQDPPANQDTPSAYSVEDNTAFWQSLADGCVPRGDIDRMPTNVTPIGTEMPYQEAGQVDETRGEASLPDQVGMYNHEVINGPRGEASLPDQVGMYNHEVINGPLTCTQPGLPYGEEMNETTGTRGAYENSSTGSSDDLLLLIDMEVERYQALSHVEQMAEVNAPLPLINSGVNDLTLGLAITSDEVEVANLIDSIPPPTKETDKQLDLELGVQAGNNIGLASVGGYSLTTTRTPHDKGKQPCAGLTLACGSTSAPTTTPKNAQNDNSSDDYDDIDEMNDPNDIAVGMRFANRDEFKHHMALYAIQNKFHFRNLRSRPQLMVLICNGPSCNWRVYAVRVKNSPAFEIRKVNRWHQCSVDDRRNYQRQATTQIIGDMMRARYVGSGSGPRPNEIRDLMRGDHDVRISYWKAWNSRQIAMGFTEGSLKTSYSKLPRYLGQLVMANPGTIVELQTMYEEGIGERFKYLFFSFGASIKGFKFMRKVIVIDGTHLRGHYAGCLISASAQDGDYSIFPLAFAIVDGENDKAWEWFFRQLASFVPNEEDILFVSDRHASIYTGLNKVFPKAKHCACVVHLRRNIKTYFKNRELAFMVTRAAYAYKLSDFNRIFMDIKRLDSECASYLAQIGFHNWARSHFVGKRYNLMTSNIAESWNAAIREARAYPICDLVEHIRSKLMTWFSTRRAAAAANGDKLTKKIKGILAKNFETSAGYEVKNINKSEIEVRDKNGFSFHVNLVDRSCSCFAFQMLEFPCSHAIAAAIKENVRVNSLVPTEFHNETLRLAYEGNINPVTETDAIDELSSAIENMNLCPPRTKRPPGRPKTKRFLSRGEHQLKGIRRRIVCSRCKKSGHNRATCNHAI